MKPRLLLDTHVLLRWLAEPKKLSREQARRLDQALRRGEPVAISTISLLEIALLMSDLKPRASAPLGDLLAQVEAQPAIRILPLTAEVAAEVAALGDALRDPADRTIVATARVARLTLLTSDTRILESGLVTTID